MPAYDEAVFRRWLVLERGMKPITADRILERIRFAKRQGFDLGGFLAGDGAAHTVGGARLEHRLATSTVHAFNNDVKALNALASWAGFTTRFRLRREPRRQLRALDRDQIARLIRYEHEEPQANRFRRALVLVFLETGARPSEVAKLETQDLDARRSRIHIRFPAKGGMVRWIPVSRWIWSPKRPLGAYLRHRPNVPGSRALWTSTLYPQAFGVPRSVGLDHLRNALYDVGKDVGIPVSANVLRHTKATELRRRGYDILYIKFILGHARISSTEVYAELTAHDVETLYRRRPTPDYYREADDQ